jgi:hypothetical protein
MEGNVAFGFVGVQAAFRFLSDYCFSDLYKFFGESGHFVFLNLCLKLYRLRLVPESPLESKLKFHAVPLLENDTFQLGYFQLYIVTFYLFHQERLCKISIFFIYLFPIYF